MLIYNNLWMFPLSYRFLEYKAAQDQTDVAQPSVSACFSNVLVYSSKSPRQQAINASIIKDLVIGCGLPLALVENCYFRKFLKVMDSKYTPISRSTISEKRIPVLVNQVKQTIVERLQRQPSVSVTVDIWSDHGPFLASLRMQYTALMDPVCLNRTCLNVGGLQDGTVVRGFLQLLRKYLKNMASRKKFVIL